METCFILFFLPNDWEIILLNFASFLIFLYDICCSSPSKKQQNNFAE